MSNDQKQEASTRGAKLTLTLSSEDGEWVAENVLHLPSSFVPDYAVVMLQGLDDNTSKVELLELKPKKPEPNSPSRSYPNFKTSSNARQLAPLRTSQQKLENHSRKRASATGSAKPAERRE